MRAVDADLRRRHRVDAVAIPQVGAQTLGARLVEHAGLEALEIRSASV